jgi:o-succinylbenzoate synthase
LNIARVRWTAYRVPFRAPYATSQGTSTHREGLLVELTADDGRAGFGEAAPTPETCLEASTLAAAFKSKARELLGREVEELASLEPPRSQPDESAAALDCAIDTAVCDLLARSRGLNIARLLRPNAASEVAINALVTRTEIVEAAQAAMVARDAGYRTLKLKVGMEASAAEESARIAAVRKAIGPGVKLRLDPNGAWDLATALEILGIVAPLNIEYVEQPLPAGSLESMRYIQQHTMIPIAADEDVTGFEAALRIIETRAARVLILKPQRIGGLRACREIMALAKDAGLACVVTTSIETGIGTAACLQLSASLPSGSPACGLATASLLESDLTNSPLAIEHGSMRLLDATGLGVHLDGVALQQYTNGWREVA